MQRVIDGELPVNHAILGNLQDIFNLLPNLSTPKTEGATSGESELSRAMSIKTNDQLMSIYLSSLIRAITAFHDLIDNKIQNKQQAEDKENKKEEDKQVEKIKKEDKLALDGKDTSAEQSKEDKSKTKDSADKKKG